jgi:hypothetical protein
MNSDFLFDYQFILSPDAEKRLAQAWDLILSLILEDIKSEQQEKHDLGDKTC